MYSGPQSKTHHAFNFGTSPGFAGGGGRGRKNQYYWPKRHYRIKKNCSRFRFIPLRREMPKIDFLDANRQCEDSNQLTTRKNLRYSVCKRMVARSRIIGTVCSLNTIAKDSITVSLHGCRGLQNQKSDSRRGKMIGWVNSLKYLRFRTTFNKFMYEKLTVVM